jgi:hypothetical protein
VAHSIRHTPKQSKPPSIQIPPKPTDALINLWRRGTEGQSIHRLNNEPRLTCHLFCTRVSTRNFSSLTTLLLNYYVHQLLELGIRDCATLTMNLISREQDEDQEAFLPKSHEDASFLEDRPKDLISTVKGHARLVLEIFMGLLIFLLLVNVQGRKTIQASTFPTCRSLTHSLYAKLARLPRLIQSSEVPMKKYLFVENPRYLHENMFASKEETLHTLHNWIELSSCS